MIGSENVLQSLCGGRIRTGNAEGGIRVFGLTEEVKIGIKSQVVNGRISLVKKPRDWAKEAYGCCKGAWGDKPFEHLAKEREAWE